MSDNLLKAIKRYSAARTPVNTGGLEPSANRVRGQSGSSADNAYKNATRAFDFSVFTGAEIGDGVQKRKPAVKKIKKAVKKALAGKAQTQSFN